MDSVVVLPGFHAHHALSEVDEIRQGPRHGTENAGYALLACHARYGACFRPSPCRATEGVDASKVGRHADGASDIRTNAYATASVSQQGAFAAGRSSWRVVCVVRVGGATPDIVG